MLRVVDMTGLSCKAQFEVFVRESLPQWVDVHDPSLPRQLRKTISGNYGRLGRHASYKLLFRRILHIARAATVSPFLRYHRRSI